MNRALAALAGVLIASVACAQEAPTGVYDLQGSPTSGGAAYSGTARVDVNGDELILTTDLAGEGRGQSRTGATPNAHGCWVFDLSDPDGVTVGGMRGSLDRLGGDGRREFVPTKKRELILRRRGDGLQALVRVGGKIVARETLTPRSTPRLAVTAVQPRSRHFRPHHPSQANSVSVRYHLEPVNTPLDVEIRIEDRDGAVVAAFPIPQISDEGEGRLFEWDGATSHAGGFVDARKSPFSITVHASRAGAHAVSEPVRAIAVPLIDRCFVISRADAGGELTSENKIVAYGARPEIVGVVRAIVGGVRAADRGHTERAYFVVGGSLPATHAQIAGVGRVRLEAWDSARWSGLNLRWETVMPLPLHAPAYRPTQAARRNTRDGEFTNVMANGDAEGSWLGRDVVEYEHTPLGVSATPRIDPQPGTVRYRFDVDYRRDELRLGPAERPGSFGQRGGPETTATRAHSGLTQGDFDRSLSGASPRIHRISRRGKRSNLLLSYLETYRRVPWIYGSLGNQVLEFVGYDCADLVLGAARHAGLSGARFTNAHNLCEVITRARGSHPVLMWDEDWNTVNARTGAANPVACGGSDRENLQPGDVVFFDWDTDGKWDHTTVVWECGSGTLDRSTRFVWAHHDSSSPDGFHIGPLSELVHSGSRHKVRMKLRRFRSLR